MKDNAYFFIMNMIETYIPAGVWIRLNTMTSCFIDFKVTKTLEQFHTLSGICKMFRIANAFI